MKKIYTRNKMVRVLKFGGTSMLHMERVLDVIENFSSEQLFVVVSSIGKTTDWLKKENIERVRKAYLDWAKPFNVSPTCINYIWNNARSIINNDANPKERQDLLLSYGEKCASYCLASALMQRHLRAKVLTGVYVEGNYGDSKITHFNIPNDNCIFIVPGFYGYDNHGHVKTIGESGSDITAGVLAKTTNASEVIIYTDVNGVFTADPRRVDSANLIPKMNYSDVIELGFAGGNVLHPRTVSHLIGTNAIFWVRNLFDGDGCGTMIDNTNTSTLSVAIRDNQIFVTVEKTSMFGIPGIASSIFDNLAKKRINVSLITQSCSETSISFAMDESKIDLLYDLPIREILRVSIVTLVGANMKNRIGIAAQFFRSLSTNQINVIGIAQGSTERSLSAIVLRSDGDAALKSIHKHVIETYYLF